MVTVEEVALNVTPVQQRGSPDSANHTANANREGNIPMVPEKPSGDGYNWQKYGQQGSPDSANHPANANREDPFPVVPEKPSEDGYNWRKYGQKNIKGNKNIRSYYRCSYHKCLVKKQVERAPDGRITDTSYFGMHDHPKPQTGLSVGLPSDISMKVQTGDKRSSVASEEKSPRVHAHALIANDAEVKDSNELAVLPIMVEDTHDMAPPSSVAKDYGNSDDNVASKRRKTGDDYDVSMDHKTKSRWVVETISAVDVVNDGYRWRKYGQKLVKDNPNARSYYRCTNSGCPAKKRVERASHDPTVVITTYDGHHDHDFPQGRTLLPHSNSPASNIPSGQHNNSVSPKGVIRPHQNTAAISKELANAAKNTDEKDIIPEGYPAQTSAAHCKEERPEKDDLAEGVNQTQSSTAIKQGNAIDHPVEKVNAAEDVKQAESSEPKQVEMDNAVEEDAKQAESSEPKQVEMDNAVEDVKQAESSEPKQVEMDNAVEEDVKQAESSEPKQVEMDNAVEDVKQAESSEPKQVEMDNAVQEDVKQAKSSEPKQEQGKSVDLPAKNDEPLEEVNQNESSGPICNQEQGKTIDPPDEVNQAQNSDVICKQEEGNTIEHSAEKVDPPEEVDQGHSIETSCKQEPAEEMADKMI